VTYGELAELSGRTKSSSIAVGQAMRKNPVMILVPCHRVVPSSGGTGNYAGGKKNEVKVWLLNHESAYI
jgi:methylated-DNA-[protein]-cysteine S-methyltransferase